MKLHTLHTTRNRKTTCPSFSIQPEAFDPSKTVYLREYGRVELRPIRPDDEDRMVDFHEGLTEESIYLRYFEHISLDTRTLHERLARICVNTGDFFGIVAELHATKTHRAQILGVGRLTTTDEPGTTSFAMLIGDEACATDLPRKLFERLIEIARAYGFRNLAGEFLIPDVDAIDLCREKGFSLQTIPEDGLIAVNLPL